MRHTPVQMNASLRAVALLLAVVGSGAHAAGTVLYEATATADASAAAPLGFTASLASSNDPLGGGLVTSDILFTALSNGIVTITLTDLGTVVNGRTGSVYEALLDGVSLGTTSPTPVDGASFSKGSFSASVLAGKTYDLGVWNIVSTFAGFDSPYGGAANADFQQSNLSIQIAQSVPEPSSALLLSAGLLASAVLGGRTAASRRLRD